MEAGIPQVAVMMTELSATLTRYMARKLAKSHACCSGSLVSPRRRNSVMWLWFPLGIGVLQVGNRKEC